MMEGELIAWLRSELPSHRCLKLGLGDDAAVVDLEGQTDCVVTADMVMEGVHFELGEVDPARIGHKALAVNLSDLAAMASRPLAAIVSVALPQRGGLELAKAIYSGMLPLAERHEVVIAGGDTNSWNGPLVINVTVFGAVGEHGVWRRSGAEPGDRIVVTGALGGSRLGRHLDFEPRVREALRLAQRYTIHAAIDISDSLTRDLSHLTTESGCGAEIDLDKIPIAGTAQQLADTDQDGMTALDHALGDGEDFELLMAVAPAEAERMVDDHLLDIPLTLIGRFVKEHGLWQIDAQDRRTPLEPRGYEHRMEP